MRQMRQSDAADGALPSNAANLPTIFTADKADERLDVFVSRVADITRAHAQKLIIQGLVTVDSAKQKSNYRLRVGETVAVTLPHAAPLSVAAENIPLNILYEDSDIIVIDKARGMTVHPAAGVSSGTLVNALLFHCRDLSGINGVLRPGIVHRLDKDTSGVMVAAKNDAAHLSLAAQLADKTMHRKYLALVCGIIGEEQGTIKGRIGRSTADRKMMAITPTGKDAVTHFRVLQRFKENYTLIECRLETGRTHQIRVHMNYIGHPVVGDPKYGRKKCPFTINGQALHSAKLTLKHPTSGEIMTFAAPLPDDMEEILRELGNDAKFYP